MFVTQTLNLFWLSKKPQLVYKKPRERVTSVFNMLNIMPLKMRFLKILHSKTSIKTFSKWIFNVFQTKTQLEHTKWWSSCTKSRQQPRWEVSVVHRCVLVQQIPKRSEDRRWDWFSWRSGLLPVGAGVVTAGAPCVLPGSSGLWLSSFSVGQSTL